MPGLVRENADVDSNEQWRPLPMDNRSPRDDLSVRQVNVNGAVNGVVTEKVSTPAGNLVNGQLKTVTQPPPPLSPATTSPPTTTAALKPDTAMSPASDLPPEIEHITVGYQPVSTLISRLCQAAFNELRDVINAMAEMPVAPPRNGVTPGNGQMTVNGAGDDSPANVQKKMRLMKFTQDRRAQFIKALVLTQWSRQSAEVSKVIDLKIWLDRQRSYYDEAWFWLGDMKRSLAPAKMPNPDIDTALEALSTGKSKDYPDLGYIPSKPLTPQEMLKAVRNINILLSLRLNLHETIPPPLKNYDIHDGRVTFEVAGEFEIDLSIADEDPASQFFFIDFRFLFWPSSTEAPSGWNRDQIEAKVNTVLQKGGLQGCYHFLHELVLTHKINTLRRQAFDMSREKWSGMLKLELLHRTLVVHYWVNRPGKKNWIELGIVSGDKKDLAGRVIAHPISRIALRAFFQGKQVKDISSSVSLRLDHLNMEKITKEVIAFQVNRTLSDIRLRLLGIPLYADGRLALQQIVSVEPADCALKIQLTASTTATLKIEPITGRFALQPTWGIFNRVEAELNMLREPGVDAFRHLFKLRCLIAMAEVENRASCVGLQPWKSLRAREEDIKRVFPRDTRWMSVFRRFGWTNWILAMSITPRGEVWWIIELLSRTPGHRFGDFQRVPIESSTGSVIDPTFDFLTRLSTEAGKMIAHYVNARALKEMHVKHALARTSSQSEPSRHLPTLLINFPSLIAAGRNWKPWARDVLKMTCHSVSLRSGEVVMVAESRLLNVIPHVLQGGGDAELIFHRSGTFAIRLVSPVGQPIVVQLKERLHRLEILFSFLDILRRYKMAPETVSLGRIEFVYSEEPRLTADLSFLGGHPMSMTFAGDNPHLRIVDFLNTTLNDLEGGGGLERVVLLMRLTLPLMRVLDEIERTNEGAEDDGDLFVLARSTGSYQLCYERPRCTFSIRLRKRRDMLQWYVQMEKGSSYATSHPPALVEGLRRLMDESGDGWVALHTGIAAEMHGIVEVVRRIDRLMKEHRPQEQVISLDEKGTSDTAATQQQQAEKGQNEESPSKPGPAPKEVITVPD